MKLIKSFLLSAALTPCFSTVEASQCIELFKAQASASASNWTLNQIDIPPVFNNGFYSMGGKVELDSSATRLRVTNKVLDPSARGNDEVTTVYIVPFGTAKSTSEKSFKPTPAELVGKFASTAVGKAYYRLHSEIKDAVIQELTAQGMDVKYGFVENFSFKTFYDLGGSVNVFKGPLEGTLIFTAGMNTNTSNSKASEGIVTLVDFRLHRNDGLTKYLSPAAAEKLPLGFDVAQVKFSDMRLVLTSKDGQQITLAYELGSQGPQLRNRNLFEKMMDGQLDLSVLRGLQQIANLEAPMEFNNPFTGPYFQVVEGLQFGLYNSQGESYLRVVEESSNAIIFEQGLGKELNSISIKDPDKFSGDNAHNRPYGVQQLLKAPNTAAYTKAGIEYVVVLTDGSVYTVNLGIGN
jgi:hypothetical protein